MGNVADRIGIAIVLGGANELNRYQNEQQTNQNDVLHWKLLNALRE